MMPTHRTRFLATVRQALGADCAPADVRRSQVFPARPDTEARATLDKIGARAPQDREALLTRLKEQAMPLRLQVSAVNTLPAAARKIAALARQTPPEWGDDKSVIRWSHPLVDALELESLLAEDAIPVYTTAMGTAADRLHRKQTIREHTIASFMGITAADYCLADTATVVMKTRPDQGRAVSLAPSVHVAIVMQDQLLADLTELYAVLEDDRYNAGEGLTHHMVFISGPSKTADIELTMVHGAHGPREMHLLVIRG